MLSHLKWTIGLVEIIKHFLEMVQRKDRTQKNTIFIYLKYQECKQRDTILLYILVGKRTEYNHSVITNKIQL